MLKQEKYPVALFCAALVTLLFAAVVVHLTVPAAQEGGYSVTVARGAQVETAPQRPLLDINTASAAELEQLHGVGAVLAENIVAHREEHGAFSSVEELLQVKGIGEKKLAEFRHEITLEGETT